MAAVGRGLPETMRLTGAAAWSGWPVPGCGCASCAAAGRDGGQPPTAVLLPGLLIDPALPSVLAGERAETLLLTGLAPPQALAWYLATRPGPAPQILTTPVAPPPGVAVRAGAYEVRVAGPGVLSIDGELLIAPGVIDDDAAAMVAHSGRHRGAVLACPQVDQLLRGVATLRRHGALAEDAVLLAGWASHANVAPAELSRQLAQCGITLAGHARPADSPPTRVLIIGGSRSGKSGAAERRLLGFPRVDYLATGPPPSDADPEWATRVAAHRGRRPSGWTTVETADPAAVLAAPGAPALLDSVGTWLATKLGDLTAADRLVSAVATTPRPVVIVAEDVGSGMVPLTAVGRQFRDELGSLTSRLAAVCDQVWRIDAGVERQLR